MRDNAFAAAKRGNFEYRPSGRSSSQGGGVVVANGNLILAVAQGLRPPQIVGAVANLRSTIVG